MTHDPNTVACFSPTGEKFEMSPANARDLVSHAGWSYSATLITAPASKQEPNNGGADSPRSIENADKADTGSKDEKAGAQTTGGEDGEAKEHLTTVEAFDHLPERSHIVDYLAEHFPEFKPHHKSSRDGLVARAIELAKGIALDKVSADDAAEDAAAE